MHPIIIIIMLIIREMQMKTTMKYHLTPVRMAIIKMCTNNKGQWGCREKEIFVRCWWECTFSSVQFSSVSQSCLTLRPHESQHAGPPCPSPTPGVHSPSSQWCHPTISSSVVPFSSCPQSLPASESFPMSWLFTLGGQSIALQHQSFQWIFRVDFL